VDQIILDVSSIDSLRFDSYGITGDVVESIIDYLRIEDPIELQRILASDVKEDISSEGDILLKVSAFPSKFRSSF
jgi:hypothetical protein